MVPEKAPTNLNVCNPRCPWFCNIDVLKLVLVDFPRTQSSRKTSYPILILPKTPCFFNSLRPFKLMCPNLRCLNLVLSILDLVDTLNSLFTTFLFKTYTPFFLDPFITSV